MKIHVLPGDAIVETFRETNIVGEIIVCREGLIEGSLKADTLQEFWQVRADFIKETCGEEQEKYFGGVALEFEKLLTLGNNAAAEINLWFEYELFCQVNMWFCLYLLKELKAAVYRVAPAVRTENEIWKGFGGLDSNDLKSCYEQRTSFTQEDILLGANLWEAYQKSDFKLLQELSETKSNCFPYLKEVCRAAMEQGSQPKEILREIIASGITDFKDIFPAFSARAGVYGFGDSQVKRIMQ